jgi:hypothetical protein
MQQIEKPRINLKEMDFVTCDACGFDQFKEVTFLKKVPKLMTGSSEDTVVPFPTYACIKCGRINDDLNPFYEEPKKLDI